MRKPQQPESPLPATVRGQPLLVWRYHGLRARRHLVWPVSLVVGVLAALGFGFLGPLGLVLTLAFVLFPLAVFFFPTTFILTDQGVALSNWIQRDFRSWQKFKGYTEQPDAIQLHFASGVHRLMLGGYTLFFHDNAAEVRSVVGRFLAAIDASASQGGNPAAPARQG